MNKMNKNYQILILFLVVLLAGLVWSAWKVDAAASTITVNTLEDELIIDGDCSLREAIEAANTNAAVDGCAAGEASVVDTITFEVAGTITLSEQLEIMAAGSLVIEGGNEITISGGNNTRVMYVYPNSTLTLQRLTIADGYIEGERSVYYGDEANGAGLYGDEANITILECQFLENHLGESSSGGGIYIQNGIITVVDSVFERNGSNANDTYCGGVEVWGGKADFIRTTFIHNESGGFYIYGCTLEGCDFWIYAGGGGLCSFATVIIQESSFILNTGGEGAGGIHNRGDMTILNSTFSKNLAVIGGECHRGGCGNYTLGGGGILNKGNIAIINSTFSENSAPNVQGGGIKNAGNAYIANSIVANNDLGNCDGSISDGGHNISSDDTCGFDITNNSFPTTDPVLGPLQNNGGPTETYALLEGSPAIDAGSPDNCPLIDQRGMPRPMDGDDDGEAVCDIGAFELEKGIALNPIHQSNSGGLGTTLVHSLELYNFSDQADTYTLTLDSHAWETSLSTDQIGPLEVGTSETFTVAVTIPMEAAWYQTDDVTITATSISNPGVYSTSAQLTTQAYAPPLMSVNPQNLEINLLPGQSITQLLTISNGNGVTLDYTLYPPFSHSAMLLHLDEPVGAFTFLDASEYSNDGACSTTENCPTAGVSGIYGSAVNFDGVNDYIRVDDAPSLNPQNAITISAWILANDWYGNRRIVQKGGSDTQYRLLAENGNFHFVIATVGRVTAVLPSTNTWHHVLGVYDGTHMQLWVDGALQAEVYWSGLIPTTTDPVYIGTKYPGAPMGDFFLGKIDEVQIFDRALSPAEIQHYYTFGYITSEIHWLTIDPLSGSIPTNSSLPVQVTFDATGLQPDSYETIFSITSNDPVNPMVQVPVVMNVVGEGKLFYLPLAVK